MKIRKVTPVRVIIQGVLDPIHLRQTCFRMLQVRHQLLLEFTFEQLTEHNNFSQLLFSNLRA
jgi:hypothetical protein